MYYSVIEKSLYYLESRYYDSSIGRFISSDSIEYLDPENIDGLNLYVYCGNNHLKKVSNTALIKQERIHSAILL